MDETEILRQQRILLNKAKYLYNKGRRILHAAEIRRKRIHDRRQRRGWYRWME